MREAQGDFLSELFQSVAERSRKLLRRAPGNGNSKLSARTASAPAMAKPCLPEERLAM